MRFTVTFTASARDQLAAIWLSASDREQVASAAKEIDRALREAPLESGESRVVDIRIIIEAPLAVYADVRPGDRTVKVWRVWRWGR
jgi:hypothetical protein